MQHAKFKPHALVRTRSFSQRPSLGGRAREPQKTIIPKDPKVHQGNQQRCHDYKHPVVKQGGNPGQARHEHAEQGREQFLASQHDQGNM